MCETKSQPPADTQNESEAVARCAAALETATTAPDRHAMANVRIVGLLSGVLLLCMAVWYMLKPIEAAPQPGGNPHRFASAVVQEMKANAKTAQMTPLEGVTPELRATVPPKGATAAAQASSLAVAAKAAGAATARAASTPAASKTSKREKLETTLADLAEMLKIMKEWSSTSPTIAEQAWWPASVRNKLNMTASVKPEWRKNVYIDLSKKLEKIKRRSKAEAEKARSEATTPPAPK